MPLLPAKQDGVNDYPVSEPGQLDSLSPLPFLHHKGLGIIRLANGLAKLPDRDRWEESLNRDYNACGCEAGGRGMVIGFLAAGAWTVYPLMLGLSQHDYLITTILLLAVGGSLLGKACGLVTAHWRLKRTIREIKSLSGGRAG